jgi:PAS domain S-box-containing protein
MKTSCSKSIKYIVSLFCWNLLALFLIAGVDGQTLISQDTTIVAFSNDTLLTDFDKVKLYLSLSTTFDKTPEKSLKYDELGIKLAKKHKWINQLINASINYAIHSNELCSYKQADSVLSSVEDLINRGEWNVKKADYYYQKASNYYDWSRYQLAKEYYEKALIEFKKHKNKIGIAKTFKGLGITVSVWSDYEGSIGYLQQARDIYTEFGDQQGIETINLAMGVVMEQWGKIDVALNYYENALNYFEEKHDIFNQANLRLHIGDLYIKKGNYNKALDYYFTAENLEKLKPHKKLRAITLSNIAEAFYFMGKYREAMEYQDEALKLKYEIGDRKRIAISLIDLGKIHLALKNYNKAVNYAKEGYKIANMSLLSSEALESLHLLSEGYSSLRKLDSAYFYLNKYIVLKDKIFNDENTKTLNNLQIKYNTREKEKENQVLKLKNSQNELLLRKERDAKYLTFIVTLFIFLITLVILLFLRARDKQNRKNNFMLQYKNTEITKQKEKLSVLNSELIESRAKYMSIVENATIGMYRTTRDGKILFANKTLLNMIRSTWEEIKEINLNKIKPDRKKLLSLVDRQKIVTGREDIWDRRDGSKMFVNESMWIVQDGNGKLLYYEGIVEDITKRKIAENKLKENESALIEINRELLRNNEELEKARVEIEKAYKTKSEFLANISHEIRTPLNAIIGFTDLLMQKVKGEGQLQYVQAIRSSGRNLLSLINDILDLSKIQAGKIELHFEPVVLNQIVNDISRIFTLSVKEKGLEFRVKTHPSLTKLIFLDDTRMRQILFNLIGNAVKFTDKGFIELDVDVTNESRESLDIKITITDTGSGIPVGKQAQVFEAFVQSDNSRKHSGSGLGLSITKRLVEIMNGTISMSSKPGDGTVFTVFIPGIKIFEGERKGEKTVHERQLEFSATEEEDAAFLDLEFSRDELSALAASDFTDLFKKRCEAAQSGHVIKDIISCCDDLVKFADENSFKKLYEVAVMLKEASVGFDIEKVKLFLQVIKELFTKIEDNETKQ